MVRPVSSVAWGVAGELRGVGRGQRGSGRGDAAAEAQGAGAAGELECAGRETPPASSGARSTDGDTV